MDIFWKKLLETHLQFHEVIILYGNIHDRFPSQEGQHDLNELIEEVAKQIGYEQIGFFDEFGGRNSRREPTLEVKRIGDINVGHDDPRSCWILQNLSATFPEVKEWNKKDWDIHEQLLAKIRESNNRHRFLMIFPDEGRIPGNFLVNVPGVKRLIIPFPDFSERMEWVKQVEENQPQTFTSGNDEDKEEILKRFVAVTEGLHWRDLHTLAVINANRPNKEPVATVRQFKFGKARDYWSEILKRQGDDSLANAKNKFINGNDPILGQDEAVEKALKIVAKACFNLGSIVAPAYNRPKGVLFLVGPTGVGKTMLSKKLAKLIFGDESSCTVFDMSEYSDSHSDARLIGAPPGYVGYDAGGQLTTALQQRPFSVIVFDEIDKAHPSILTKFLQILDEGRLTDGKGQSCYFSESLIIFTSNFGAKQIQEGRASLEENEVQTDSEYSTLIKYYQQVLKEARGLEQHPEILNRIGLSNIIPFRHIMDDSHVNKIIGDLLEKTISHFDTEFGVLLIVEDTEELINHIAACTQWQEYGMRNVKQTFESEVLETIADVKSENISNNNPLSIRVENGSIVVGVEK